MNNHSETQFNYQANSHVATSWDSNTYDLGFNMTSQPSAGFPSFDLPEFIPINNCLNKDTISSSPLFPQPFEIPSTEIAPESPAKADKMPSFKEIVNSSNWKSIDLDAAAER